MTYIPLLQRPKTYFIDIDGTILRQIDKWESGTVADEREFQALPGSVRTINDLFTAGHTIILVTARGEPYQSRTMYQMERIGLQYDRLIMGLPTGQRILINDRKPQEQIETAIAINLDRDVGLGVVSL